MATSHPNYFELPTVTQVVRDNITIYTNCGELDAEVQASFMSYLVARLNSCAPNSIEMVEGVLACMCAAMPSMASHLISMKSLHVHTVVVTEDDIGAMIGDGSSGHGPLARLFSADATVQNALALDQPESAFAAVSSIVYVIGKQGSEGPEASIMKMRPDALIRKFTLPESSQQSLPGRPYGPSQETMKAIYATFATYTEPRMKLVQFMIAMAHQTGHLTKVDDILITNFRLLRGAGMTHVEAILRFVNMHPWTARVPELAPYYRKFANELARFSEVPIHIRQYHRLLVPQSEFLFITAEYRPLIAVAASYISEIETTFSGYTAGITEHSILIATVRRYEPATSKYVGGGSLAEALGVPEMELPTQRPSDTVASRAAI